MIFIDAGAFVARYRPSDRWYHSALEGWKRLELSGEPIATSSSVIYEALNLIGRYAGHARSLWLAEQVFRSKLIILRPTESDETEAIAIARKLIEHEIGFIDCVSFAIMRRHNIGTAFSFDRHFRYAGFTPYTETD